MYPTSGPVGAALLPGVGQQPHEVGEAADPGDHDPRTRALLKERTITVWLDAPVDVLAERTGRRDTRPLLKNGDRKATLERLAEIERQAYSEADIHVKSGDGAHREVVEAIVEALDEHLANRNAA